MSVFSNTLVRQSFLRYILYIFIFLELIFLPNYLQHDDFVQLEYMKLYTQIAPLVTFGLTGGSMILFLKEKRTNLFSKVFLPYLLIFIVVSIIVGLYTFNISIAIIIFLVCMALFMEVVLRLNGYYFASFLYKPLVSVFMLFLVVILGLNFDISQYILANIIAVCVLIISGFKFLRNLTFEPIEMFKIIKCGFPLSVGSGLIALIVLVERHFAVENGYDLTSFTLGYVIMSLGVLLIGTLNMLISTEMGRNNDYRPIWKLFLFSFGIGILYILLIDYLVSSGLMKQIYPDIDISVAFFNEIAIPRLFFFVTGSVTPSLVYKAKLFWPNLFTLTAMIVVIIYCLFFVDSLSNLVRFVSLIIGAIGLVNLSVVAITENN